jgi:hypothetical protein
MDLGKIDRVTLKAIIRDILREDITLFKDVIKEVLIENQVIKVKKEENRTEKIEKMIEQDFDKYDEVFKTLA